MWSRDTTKKEFIENQQKRNRRPETKESVCQGLLLAPIHRDTQMDLKTEKRRCGQGTQQKRRKWRTKNKKNKVPG